MELKDKTFRKILQRFIPTNVDDVLRIRHEGILANDYHKDNIEDLSIQKDAQERDKENIYLKHLVKNPFYVVVYTIENFS